jgi:polyphosphate kinase
MFLHPPPVTGTLLEHPCLYYFRHGDQDEVLLRSADLMLRYLDHRVDILFPMQDASLRQSIIHDILSLHLQDAAQARRLSPDGTYERLSRRLVRRRSIRMHGCYSAGKITVRS